MFHDLKRGLICRVQLPLLLQLPLHVRKVQSRSHSAVNIDDPSPAESQQNGQRLPTFQHDAFRVDASGRRAQGGKCDGKGGKGRVKICPARRRIADAVFGTCSVLQKLDTKA